MNMFVYNKNYNKKQCINCGTFGHTIKLCNSPITSYGIICYTIIDNTIKYLMIQRKNSITYIEFIRGKYSLDDVDYIDYLFQNMTVTERNIIKENSIENLWKMLWTDHVSQRLNLEFKDSKIKFNKLETGYLFKRRNDTRERVNLTYIINKANLEHPQVIMNEWEFPKGRRNLNETDLDCALREFEEESSINSNDIVLCNLVKKPIEEIFLSLNKTRYKHVYYIGHIDSNKAANIILYSGKNKIQCKEVQNVMWMTYEEIISKIRCNHVQRIELFKRVNKQLMQLYNSH